VVVSACLLGERVRWDGGDKLDARVVTETTEAAREGRLLPLCPEVLAGFGCPRPPIHFVTGHGGAEPFRAEDDRGADVTAALASGADRAVRLLERATRDPGRSASGSAPVSVQAILKEGSPSCGCTEVHGPGGRIEGRGCFAAALLARDATVENERGVPARKLPVINE
jgi:uncharacterized protein YbbK (DUF523 family)